MRHDVVSEEPWPNEVIHRDLQADEEDAFEVGAGLLQVVEATRP